MTDRWSTEPPSLRATTLLHQEGFFGVLALVGLAFRQTGLAEALLPRSTWTAAVGMGFLGATLSLLVLYGMLLLPALRKLEQWQAALVREWTATDAVAVALMSGVCEEALLRALLQGWVGLVPAALLFAVLHVVPDRRLWMWPVVAFAMGVVFGLLFEKWGYPAAALAHMLVNLVSLLRLRHLRAIRETA